MNTLEKSVSKVDRRNFLVRVLKISGQITMANTAIYAVSLVSSKGSFGGLTAGAKGAGWYCIDPTTNSCAHFSGTPTYTNGPYPSISACYSSPSCQ
ncbi:MAG: hypothetical protein H7256_04070 [Bdellovibrio sp.]|nr:hypothetical protein [Bdellovibrio sp.]